MTYTSERATGETFAPKLGITPEAIDRVFAESRGAALDEEFNLLPAGLRVLAENMTFSWRRSFANAEVADEEPGEVAADQTISEIEAGRLQAGLLLAHRLVRTSVPTYYRLDGDKNFFARKFLGQESLSYRDSRGRTINYLPKLEREFVAAPQTFHHLLESFTNDTSRHSAQLMLLSLSGEYPFVPA